ncbi:HNH endonuclease [Microbacterium terricola]|uniref:HNH nuclease domain-containing protein n=1 Tax=Microbacterium terricola TaxID=344163 RepID=A0ABM8DW92_9MICO|nr:HNH endonuclease signature motif containing protein [Microbacterium terricola]UYK39501.1 HNH endonuclease [Microbacterium terricola]BDV29766.1 hypothetical protein Microterr_04260 [Microbacterium terricola]
MTNPLDALGTTVAAAAALWSGEPIEGMAGGRLVALNEELARARRLLDGAHAQVAAEIQRQSRPELGPEGLAKIQGYRNPTALIAATNGTTAGEAARLVQVGEATAPRMLLSGECAPARHPHVAAALEKGEISTPASAAIISMLDKVAIRAGREAIAHAEQTLVAQAPGLTMDQLSKLILRAEAWLDPDGVLPREDELRADRSLRIREDRNGAVILTGTFDPEHAAPIKTAIEAIVTAQLRAAQEQPDDPDAVRRTIPQMQADALALLCSHALDCDHTDLPLGGATVIVRVSLDDLENGTGHATIDGLAAPVTVSTARRMAASGGIIPCVLGSQSEILDWGREKRLFTRAQRLALAERDDGCAMCGAPPGHTRAHHVTWWSRGGGTDLDEGLLVCDPCHHRIHDNGWEIRIAGKGVMATVWFIPPAYVDPDRTPRRGVRRRFDLAV